jgi:hypothetical protein
MIDIAMWLVLLALFQNFNVQIFIRCTLALQRALLAVYLWAYIPVLRDWMVFSEYRRAWLTLAVYHHDRLYLPLASLMTACFSLFIPNVLLFVLPFRSLWTVHILLVERLENGE